MQGLELLRDRTEARQAESKNPLLLRRPPQNATEKLGDCLVKLVMMFTLL
jgi:hypothetical protein